MLNIFFSWEKASARKWKWKYDVAKVVVILYSMQEGRTK